MPNPGDSFSHININLPATTPGGLPAGGRTPDLSQAIRRLEERRQREEELNQAYQRTQRELDRARLDKIDKLIAEGKAAPFGQRFQENHQIAATSSGIGQMDATARLMKALGDAMESGIGQQRWAQIVSDYVSQLPRKRAGITNQGPTAERIQRLVDESGSVQEWGPAEDRMLDDYSRAIEELQQVAQQHTFLRVQTEATPYLPNDPNRAELAQLRRQVERLSQRAEGLRQQIRSRVGGNRYLAIHPARIIASQGYRSELAPVRPQQLPQPRLLQRSAGQPLVPFPPNAMEARNLKSMVDPIANYNEDQLRRLIEREYHDVAMIQAVSGGTDPLKAAYERDPQFKDFIDRVIGPPGTPHGQLNQEWLTRLANLADALSTQSQQQVLRDLAGGEVAPSPSRNRAARREFNEVQARNIINRLVGPGQNADDLSHFVSTLSHLNQYYVPHIAPGQISAALPSDAFEDRGRVFEEEGESGSGFGGYRISQNIASALGVHRANPIDDMQAQYRLHQAELAQRDLARVIARRILDQGQHYNPHGLDQVSLFGADIRRLSARERSALERTSPSEPYALPPSLNAQGDDPLSIEASKQYADALDRWKIALRQASSLAAGLPDITAQIGQSMADLNDLHLKGPDEISTRLLRKMLRSGAPQDQIDALWIIRSDPTLLERFFREGNSPRHIGHADETGTPDFWDVLEQIEGMASNAPYIALPTSERGDKAYKALGQVYRGLLKQGHFTGRGQEPGYLPIRYRMGLSGYGGGELPNEKVMGRLRRLRDQVAHQTDVLIKRFPGSNQTLARDSRFKLPLPSNGPALIGYPNEHISESRIARMREEREYPIPHFAMPQEDEEPSWAPALPTSGVGTRVSQDYVQSLARINPQDAHLLGLMLQHQITANAEGHLEFVPQPKDWIDLTGSQESRNPDEELFLRRLPDVHFLRSVVTRNAAIRDPSIMPIARAAAEGIADMEHLQMNLAEGAGEGGQGGLEFEGSRYSLAGVINHLQALADSQNMPSDARARYQEWADQAKEAYYYLFGPHATENIMRSGLGITAAKRALGFGQYPGTYIPNGSSALENMERSIGAPFRNRPGNLASVLDIIRSARELGSNVLGSGVVTEAGIYNFLQGIGMDREQRLGILGQNPLALTRPGAETAPLEVLHGLGGLFPRISPGDVRMVRNPEGEWVEARLAPLPGQKKEAFGLPMSWRAAFGRIGPGLKQVLAPEEWEWFESERARGFGGAKGLTPEERNKLPPPMVYGPAGPNRDIFYQARPLGGGKAFYGGVRQLAYDSERLFPAEHVPTEQELAVNRARTALYNREQERLQRRLEQRRGRQHAHGQVQGLAEATQDHIQALAAAAEIAEVDQIQRQLADTQPKLPAQPSQRNLMREVDELARDVAMLPPDMTGAELEQARAPLEARYRSLQGLIPNLREMFTARLARIRQQRKTQAPGAMFALPPDPAFTQELPSVRRRLAWSPLSALGGRIGNWLQDRIGNLSWRMAGRGQRFHPSFEYGRPGSNWLAGGGLWPDVMRDGNALMGLPDWRGDAISRRDTMPLAVPEVFSEQEEMAPASAQGPPLPNARFTGQEFPDWLQHLLAPPIARTLDSLAPGAHFTREPDPLGQLIPSGAFEYLGNQGPYTYGYEHPRTTYQHSFRHLPTGRIDTYDEAAARFWLGERSEPISSYAPPGLSGDDLTLWQQTLAGYRSNRQIPRRAALTPFLIPDQPVAPPRLTPPTAPLALSPASWMNDQPGESGLFGVSGDSGRFDPFLPNNDPFGPWIDDPSEAGLTPVEIIRRRAQQRMRALGGDIQSLTRPPDIRAQYGGDRYSFGTGLNPEDLAIIEGFRNAKLRTPPPSPALLRANRYAGFQRLWSQVVQHPELRGGVWDLVDRINGIQHGQMGLLNPGANSDTLRASSLSPSSNSLRLSTSSRPRRIPLNAGGARLHLPLFTYPTPPMDLSTYLWGLQQHRAHVARQKEAIEVAGYLAFNRLTGHHEYLDATKNSSFNTVEAHDILAMQVRYPYRHLLQFYHNHPPSSAAALAPTMADLATARHLGIHGIGSVIYIPPSANMEEQALDIGEYAPLRQELQESAARWGAQVDLSIPEWSDPYVTRNGVPRADLDPELLDHWGHTIGTTFFAQRRQQANAPWMRLGNILEPSPLNDPSSPYQRVAVPDSEQRPLDRFLAALLQGKLPSDVAGRSEIHGLLKLAEIHGPKKIADLIQSRSGYVAALRTIGHRRANTLLGGMVDTGSRLTPEQLAIIARMNPHDRLSTLINGGAGVGKSATALEGITASVRAGTSQPSDWTILTPARRLQQSLGERWNGLMPGAKERPNISTFGQLVMRALRAGTFEHPDQPYLPGLYNMQGSYDLSRILERDERLSESGRDIRPGFQFVRPGEEGLPPRTIESFLAHHLEQSGYAVEGLPSFPGRYGKYPYHIPVSQIASWVDAIQEAQSTMAPNDLLGLIGQQSLGFFGAGGGYASRLPTSDEMIAAYHQWKLPNGEAGRMGVMDWYDAHQLVAKAMRGEGLSPADQLGVRNFFLYPQGTRYPIVRRNLVAEESQNYDVSQRQIVEGLMGLRTGDFQGTTVGIASGSQAINPTGMNPDRMVENLQGLFGADAAQRLTRNFRGNDVTVPNALIGMMDALAGGTGQQDPLQVNAGPGLRDLPHISMHLDQQTAYRHAIHEMLKTVGLRDADIAKAIVGGDLQVQNGQVQGWQEWLTKRGIAPTNIGSAVGAVLPRRADVRAWRRAWTSLGLPPELLATQPLARNATPDQRDYYNSLFQATTVNAGVGSEYDRTFIEASPSSQGRWKGSPLGWLHQLYTAVTRGKNVDVLLNANGRGEDLSLEKLSPELAAGLRSSIPQLFEQMQHEGIGTKEADAYFRRNLPKGFYTKALQEQVRSLGSGTSKTPPPPPPSLSRREAILQRLANLTQNGLGSSTPIPMGPMGVGANYGEQQPPKSGFSPQEEAIFSDLARIRSLGEKMADPEEWQRYNEMMDHVLSPREKQRVHDIYAANVEAQRRVGQGGQQSDKQYGGSRDKTRNDARRAGDRNWWRRSRNPEMGWYGQAAGLPFMGSGSEDIADWATRLGGAQDAINQGGRATLPPLPHGTTSSDWWIEMTQPDGSIKGIGRMGGKGISYENRIPDDIKQQIAMNALAGGASGGGRGGRQYTQQGSSEEESGNTGGNQQSRGQAFMNWIASRLGSNMGGATSPQSWLQNALQKVRERANSPMSVLGRSLARSGWEMSFISDYILQNDLQALQQGQLYRTAEGQQAILSGLTPGTYQPFGGVTLKEGGVFGPSYDAAEEGIAGAFPMYSRSQIREISANMAAQLGLRGQSATTLGMYSLMNQAMAVSAMGGLDPNQLAGNLGELAGLSGGRLGTSMQASTQYLNAMLAMGGGIVTNQTLQPFSQALGTVMPFSTTLGVNPMEGANLLAAGSMAGVTPGALPQLAQGINTLYGAGFSPQLSQQLSLLQIYGRTQFNPQYTGTQGTFNPKTGQYSFPSLDYQQLLAPNGLFTQLNNTLGASPSSLKTPDAARWFRQLLGMEGDILGAQTQLQFNVPQLNIDATNAQINLQQAQIGEQATQLAYGYASYYFNLWKNNQEYGPIGADVSRKAYFDFERSAALAGYDFTKADTAGKFKPETPFGLQNEEFYAGMEHQRSELVLGRSKLTSDLAFQENIKYINQQENFYQRELAIRNAERAFQQEWQKKLLDSQAAVLAAEEQLVAIEKKLEEAQIPILEWQAKILPLQYQAMQSEFAGMLYQGLGYGAGPNGSAISPTDMIYQLSSLQGQMDPTAFRALLLSLLGNDMQSYGVISDLIRQPYLIGTASQNQADEKALQQLGANYRSMLGNGAFTGSQVTASQANSQLSFVASPGSAINLANSISNTYDTAASLERLSGAASDAAASLAPLAVVGGQFGPALVGLGSIFNLLGLFTSIGTARTAASTAAAVKALAAGTTVDGSLAVKGAGLGTMAGAAGLGLGIAGLAYTIPMMIHGVSPAQGWSDIWGAINPFGKGGTAQNQSQLNALEDILGQGWGQSVFQGIHSGIASTLFQDAGTLTANPFFSFIGKAMGYEQMSPDQIQQYIDNNPNSPIAQAKAQQQAQTLLGQQQFTSLGQNALSAAIGDVTANMKPDQITAFVSSIKNGQGNWGQLGPAFLSELLHVNPSVVQTAFGSGFNWNNLASQLQKDMQSGNVAQYQGDILRLLQTQIMNDAGNPGANAAAKQLLGQYNTVATSVGLQADTVTMQAATITITNGTISYGFDNMSGNPNAHNANWIDPNDVTPHNRNAYVPSNALALAANQNTRNASHFNPTTLIPIGSPPSQNGGGTTGSMSVLPGTSDLGTWASQTWTTFTSQLQKQTPATLLSDIFGKTFATSMLTLLKNFDWKQGLTQMGTQIGGFFQKLWDQVSYGLKHAFASAWNFFADWANDHLSFLKFIGINSRVPTWNVGPAPYSGPGNDHLPSSQGGHFARGGSVYKSGSYLVGEEGPEMVNLSAGSIVYPALQTRNVTNSNKTITLNLNINGQKMSMSADDQDMLMAKMVKIMEEHIFE